MARALFQSGAVRPLIDIDTQANGRDFQCPQTAVVVIEVGGYIGKGGDGAAGGGIGRAAGCGGVNRAGEGRCAAACAASHGEGVLPAQGAVRRKVRGQVLPGVGQVAGGCPKTGRNEGAALAPVLVGGFGHGLDDVLRAGRRTKIPGGRAVKGVLQRGGGHGKHRQRKADGQQGGKILFHLDIPPFLITNEFVAPPAAVADDGKGGDPGQGCDHDFPGDAPAAVLGRFRGLGLLGFAALRGGGGVRV